MATIQATNVQIEIGTAYGTATAITGLTKADPGVATSAGHGLSNGDFLLFSVSGGMVALDDQVCRIANIATDTFELENIDTTNFATWTAGTFQEVTTWDTLCQATTINIGDAAPTELDGTTLCDTKQVTLYGLPGSISGTIDIQHDPQNTALQYLKAAAVSDTIAFRVTWSNGYITAFGGKTAYSGGFNAAINSIVTGAVPVTVPADLAEYAS